MVETVGDDAMSLSRSRGPAMPGRDHYVVVNRSRMPVVASLHLRLPDELDEYLSRSARQTRRSKNEVAALMLEEARRSRIFPGIAFRGSDWARRPFLISCGLDLWEAVSITRDYEAQPERLTDETVLRPADVTLASAYH